MEKPMDLLVAGDFYEGAYGPTILLEALSPEGIESLRAIFAELAAGGPGAQVRLNDVTGFSLQETIDVFELSTVQSRVSKRLERNGRSFDWRGTPAQWNGARDLLAPLLETSGHQYLTEEGRDDALVEVSVGEDHGLVSKRLPCPCCGYLVHDEPPGSYAICPICFWEDDNVQLRWPEMPGGANRTSLLEAQRNFAEFGACDERCRGRVRAPKEREKRDPLWRPIDPEADDVSAWGGPPGSAWPDDYESLYYWLPTFWRNGD